MNDSTRDRCILALALVAVLALRLLAWTGGEAGLAHAGQTIPTRTPTAQPVTPSAVAPSRTPAPGEPTEEPAPTGESTPTTAAPTATLPQPTGVVPSDTPLPGTSPTPATPTAAPGTLSPTADASASPTASPAAVQGATVGPGEPSEALPAAGQTPGVLAPSPTPEPLPAPPVITDGPEGATVGSSGSEQDGLAAVLLSPCLWIGLGLLLMAVGAAILIARRRSA